MLKKYRGKGWRHGNKGLSRARANNLLSCALGKPGDYPTAAGGVAPAGPATGAGGRRGAERAGGCGTPALPVREAAGSRFYRRSSRATPALRRQSSSVRISS
ncbi:hypothetical protein EMIT0111MI5_10582 [Burkholderia sp. IT-111MI5]